VADAADKKNRNIIVAAAIMVIVVVIGVGVLVWTLGGSKQEKPNDTAFANVTPTAQDAAQQVGEIGITPTSIVMAPGADGRIVGIATVSALFQPLTITSISVQGDTRVVIDEKISGACSTQNGKLQAGSRCQVTLVFKDDQTGQQTTATPTLVVSGTTLTPGGSSQPVEKVAQITGVAPSTGQAGASGAIAGGIPGAAGLPGSTGATTTAGPIAGAGIDPYGPVAPSAGNAGSAGGQQYAQQGQANLRPLTPKEQFMMARRQAVLGNIVRTPQAQAPAQSKGDWDEIGVTKTVSSMPQDMTRVVTMDRIITAVLVRPFDSRETQQVVAQVDRNVYGAMGRTILIPRGSTVIGTMSGAADRVGVVWTQIIRPDGARFVFKGAGGDAMGQAGVPGSINNRYFQRIGAAFLGTVLKVGTAKLTKAQQTAGNGDNNTIGGTIGGSAAGTINGTGALNNGGIITKIITDDINAAFAPIIAQQAALKPIITVPAGTRLTILPTQDLVMRPVQRETIVRPSYPRQMNGGAQISAPPQQQGDDQQGGSQQQAYAPQAQQTRQQDISRSFQSPTTAASGSTPPWSTN
jgi:type IV secretory pathway VirB10-like protein